MGSENNEDVNAWMHQVKLTESSLANAKGRNVTHLSGGVSPTIWNDAIFKEHHLKLIPKYVVPTLDIVRPHARYFLNFYFSGNGDPSSIINSMLCLWFKMKVNGHSLIPLDMIGETMWPAAPHTDFLREAQTKALLAWLRKDYPGEGYFSTYTSGNNTISLDSAALVAFYKHV